MWPRLHQKLKILLSKQDGPLNAGSGLNQEQMLAKMRRQKNIDGEPVWRRARLYMSKLLHRSGLRLSEAKFYFSTLIIAGCFSTIVWFWKGHIYLTALGVATGLLLPFFIIRFLAKRNIHKAVAQLPDALEIIVRSLKAGHPVPVSMNMVGREMTDPISTEFKIANHEVGFGAPPGTAIQRIAERVGHEDFDLFAAMIRLHERTGGNLADLLEGNAKTIRDRFKMRMKIKAASAEGRMSALILNAAPLLLFIFIKMSVPEFYGEVEDSQIFKYGMVAVVLWMFIGNIVMRRMINIRI